MTLPTDHWPRLKEVFAAARALPADLRAAFLVEACGGNEALQHEVESLLAVDTQAKSFLETPAILLADTMVATRLAGQRIGPYQITSWIGAGGMGEVYRARDAALGRDVAIKVLPRMFASDPDRLARFEREARMLASLNHPHVGAIYGVEQSEGVPTLILELVEGPTLADLLATGPIPLTESLGIARQMAEALEAAHARGIVHRDLKPANIKIAPDGIVKVLDFGLAEAVASDGSEDLARSPVVAASGTHESVILGTPAYMSPEQARGQTVDKRADIWAFGCVLYEMLTGRPAFTGETISDHIEAILERDPDWTVLPKAMPPDLRRVLRRCLAKDPTRRLQAIGDARVEIDDLLSGVREASAGAMPSHSLPPGRRTVPWAAAVAGAAVAIAIGVAVGSQLRVAPPPEPASVRFVVPPPADVSFRGMMALSPDGQRLALVTIDDQRRTQLWVRSMNSEVAQRVAAADGATYPFWSPDGQSIGFFADRQLKRVAAAGGPPFVICDAEDGRGGTWNRDGVIVFAPRTYSPLVRVAASGGTPQPVTQLEPMSYVAHRWPHFLPDGDHFLYLADSTPGGQSALRVGSLGHRDSLNVLDDTTEGQYSDGLLFFVRRDVLLAQPFDISRLALGGEPRAVAQGIATLASGRYAFSVTPSGALAFLRRSDFNPVTQLTWFDRGGKPTGSVGQPGRFSHPSIAPDGNRIAVTRSDDTGSAVWVFDVTRGTATPLASPGMQPVWSTEGGRIVFSAAPRKGAPVEHLWTIPADGSAPMEPLTESQFPLRAHGWSPDGARLLYHLAFGDQTTASGLWVMTMPGSLSAPFRSDGFRYPQSALSPDGHWVAYSSNQSGRFEIYVESFPTPGRRVRVSTDGGTQPRWRRDQKELYFLSADSHLIAVPVNLGVEAKLGLATPLFTLAMPGGALSGGPFLGGVGAVPGMQYDVSADGRFLAAVVEPYVPDRPPVTVTLNATAGLKPSPARRFGRR